MNITLVALALAGLFILLLVGYYYFQFRKEGRIINALPGPKQIPILGNILQFNVPSVVLFELFQKWSKEYYPAYRAWLGILPIVYIYHPDDIELMLKSSQIDKANGYSLLNGMLGTGILTGSGPKWHERRKILTSAFHFKILNKYMEAVNMQSRNVISEMSKMGDGVQISLFPFWSKHALNIICETSMGVSISGESTMNKESLKYKKALDKTTEIFIFRFFRPYVTDTIFSMMVHLKKEYDEAIETVNNFIDKVVQERRVYSKTQTKTFDDDGSDSESNKYKRKLAMLDLLLAAEKDNLIDDNGIKEEVSTVIFAGHETSAVAMCILSMLFAENKDAQERARMEVESILSAKNGENLEASDLQKMNYLERCIKEALRLYPPAPVVGRDLKEDVQLKHCLVPKGTTVVMNFYQLHRDEHFWKEPNKFDPDRFLPEEVKKRHTFSYVPFSAGLRNCIGQKFAIMELKILTSYLLYNFQLEPVDYLKDMKLQLDAIFRPYQPIHTKFVRINRD